MELLTLIAQQWVLPMAKHGALLLLITMEFTSLINGETAFHAKTEVRVASTPNATTSMAAPTAPARRSTRATRTGGAPSTRAPATCAARTPTARRRAAAPGAHAGQVSISLRLLVGASEKLIL